MKQSEYFSENLAPSIECGSCSSSPKKYLCCFALVVIALFMLTFLLSCSQMRTFFGHQENNGPFSASSQEFSPSQVQNFQSSLKTINGEIKAKYDLARHFQNSNRHLNAIEVLNGLIRIAPDFAQAYNALGVSYDALGKFEMSEKCYKMAMHLDPDLSHVANNLGYSYMLQEKFHEALPYMVMAVNMEKDNLRYQNNLARLRDRMTAAGEQPVKYTTGKNDSKPHVSVLNDTTHEVDTVPEVIESGANAPENELLSPATVEKDLAENQQPENELTDPSWPSELFQEVKSEKTIKFYKISPAVPDESQAEEKKPVAVSVAEIKEAEPMETVAAVELPRKDSRKHEADSETVVREKPESAVSPKKAAETARKENSRAIETTAPTDVEVVLVNGNGVTGFAKKTGAYLKEKGYRIRNLKNADHFNYPETRIFYRDELKPEAERLAGQLPGKIRVSAENMVHHPNNFIKVLLGKDMVFVASRDGQGYQLEISNGNGVTGAAKRLSEYLRQKGIITSRLTNADHFNHESSRIFYGKDQLDNAHALLESLPEGREAELLDTKENGNKIKLLIGKNLK